ncbi:hypothetical protein Pfo_000621 [Paulownia fortunei]|nr:hypothetical protein Pfo_000621 [Paulownia fortunei]
MEAGGGAGPGPSSVVNYNKEEDELASAVELPPGFRFHPSDEEIIIHYLLKKVMDRRFAALAMGEVDLNKCEPWDLPKKAKTGEKEWFFFSQKDRKYPTGTRTNRATESGYWKATGKDKEIYKTRNCLVGMKKTLVFYKGRAPKGERTNWVMHEYRLEGNFSSYNFSRAAKEEWVVCRVFHKKTGIKTSPGVELARMDSIVNHLLDIPTLPPLTDYSCSSGRPSSSFATDEDEFIANISSSRSIFNNHQSQMLQHDQKDFLVPPLSNYNHFSSPHNLEPNPIFVHPNSVFPYQSPSLVYQHQDGLSSMIARYPTNFAFKGGDQANLRILAPNIEVQEPERMSKMEPFSSNNSAVSHSQDTGLSTEMATEITSVHSRGELIESKKPFDQELEGLSFSPNISDLDSLWRY